MLIAQVMRAGWDGPRRYSFASGRAALVRGDGTEMALVEHDDGAAVATIERLGRALLVEVRGPTSVFVNDQRIAHRHRLRPGDELRVMLYRYRFDIGAFPADVDRSPYVAADATEQSLLAAAARDPSTREVYADWLEQRGDLVRAELLRVQHRLAQADDAGDARARLAALAAQVPAGWREQVSDPAIEACGVRFRFACPQQWAQLAPTTRSDIRHCHVCARDVYYAISVGTARTHASLGHCVALDVTSARWPQDLAAPPGATCEKCGAERSPSYPGDGCDHCGHVVARDMIVGMTA